MNSHYISINGVKIHYLTGGCGRPVVFIHGHRSDAQRFRALFQKAGEKYKIYALDLPGFGKSEELPVCHNMENYFPYILEFVQKMAFKKFILVGASMGVILANLLAQKMPDRVEKVIFLAPIFDRTSFSISKKKYIPSLILLSAFPKSRFLLKLVNRAIQSDRIFKRFITLFLAPEDRKPEIIDYEVRQWRVMHIKIWAQTLVSLVTFRFPKITTQINAKTILIFTENDQYLDSNRTVKSFAEIFPNYEVVTIPGLKHMPKGEFGQVLTNPSIKKILEKI